MIPKLDDVSVLEVGIDNSISNDMLKCWNKYKNHSMNLVDISPTSTFNGIQSQNALDLPNFKKDHLFQMKAPRLKLKDILTLAHPKLRHLCQT